MNPNIKNTIEIWSAIGMLTFGAGLAIAGFIVPPTGDISNSVLWIFAECLIYTGSIFGVAIYTQNQFTQFKHDIRKQLQHREGGNAPAPDDEVD